jgi:hypothetical protein
MISSDRPEQTGNDAPADEKPACVALVPVTTAVRRSDAPARHSSRADFIAQLIATAERLPQTRSLRRASPADAEAAYGARRRQNPAQAAGIRTRQII